MTNMNTESSFHFTDGVRYRVDTDPRVLNLRESKEYRNRHFYVIYTPEARNNPWSIYGYIYDVPVYGTIKVSTHCKTRLDAVLWLRDHYATANNTDFSYVFKD